MICFLPAAYLVADLGLESQIFNEKLCTEYSVTCCLTQERMLYMRCGRCWRFNDEAVAKISGSMKNRLAFYLILDGNKVLLKSIERVINSYMKGLWSKELLCGCKKDAVLWLQLLKRLWTLNQTKSLVLSLS